VSHIAAAVNNREWTGFLFFWATVYITDQLISTLCILYRTGYLIVSRGISALPVKWGVKWKSVTLRWGKGRKEKKGKGHVTCVRACRAGHALSMTRPASHRLVNGRDTVGDFSDGLIVMNGWKSYQAPLTLWSWWWGGSVLSDWLDGNCYIIAHAVDEKLCTGTFKARLDKLWHMQSIYIIYNFRAHRAARNRKQPAVKYWLRY